MYRGCELRHHGWTNVILAYRLRTSNVQCKSLTKN